MVSSETFATSVVRVAALGIAVGLMLEEVLVVAEVVPMLLLEELVVLVPAVVGVTSAAMTSASMLSNSS
jgi:hypothetical protein